MASIDAHIEKNHYKTSLNNGRKIIFADEPIEMNGTDEGFAPDELLCSALASCTAITLRMYADRKEWKLDEVKINVKIDVDKQNSLTTFYRNIELIGDLDAEQKQRLIQIANQCPVHKILSNTISIETKQI
ncbi:MAG: OsmC family peroxiredoxin [Bacteroidetes bacterium]|nr:MAG: OsmC family peroxiredoxin [Bacteroidota bacterium]TAG91418.1 MAG: OsmC family peroxiredoxin [Bacteroidota bacterium]